MPFPTTTSAYEMDGVAAPISGAANAIQMIAQNAEANSARSSQEARIQREWQEKQNAKAMQFNAFEAAKNRDWQMMMSNTAHQREVADLRAAGLNPVLSASGGNGASVGSGATASGVTSSGAKGDVDTSVNSALVNLLGAVYQRTTQLEAANINARTQEAIADKQAATSQIVANIGAAASRYAADRNKYGTMERVFEGIVDMLPNFNFSSGSISGRSLIDWLDTVVTSGMNKLDKKVDENDGYALITKLFPSLKKYDIFKVK